VAIFFVVSSDELLNAFCAARRINKGMGGKEDVLSGRASNA
jgi:hypothetical protein